MSKLSLPITVQDLKIIMAALDFFNSINTMMPKIRPESDSLETYQIYADESKTLYLKLMAHIMNQEYPDKGDSTLQ